MPYDVIIPARDEAPTIAAVVRAARAARGVGRVIVVDDHSSDDTAAVARAAGAEVLSSRGNGNKALALATGVDATSSEVLLFFDADISGAEPLHFERLAAPVSDGFAMSLGLIDYGRWRNAIYARLPPITGLRAVRRSVFDAVVPEKRNGFQIEIMINEVVARGSMRTAIQTLAGTGHRSKIAKLGMRRGVRAHWAMTLELLHCLTFVPLWTYVSYLRHLTVLHPNRSAAT
ncbi:MAG TPA: glycosyltransferase [Thermoanaerobaculia bacterium]|jgi:glycosyltransferase involved in cell wall biosynthesis